MKDETWPFPLVTRFEVIDHRTSTDPGDRGIRVHILAADVTLALQDDGRTLKVFLKDRDDGQTEQSVAAEWHARLSEDLEEITRRVQAGELGRYPHTVIDARRTPGTELIAVCPDCGLTRYLPLNWRELMLESMTAQDQASWDGALRCNGYAADPGDPPLHAQAVEMVITKR